jgi:hypothetical protein
LTQITHEAFDRVPRWSPDGSLIAFAHQVDRTNRTVIATMRPDGSHVRDLTTDLWGAFASGFTPDGRHIVWETQQAGFISVLWIMDSEGSNQRRLTDQGRWAKLAVLERRSRRQQPEFAGRALERAPAREARQRGN